MIFFIFLLKWDTPKVTRLNEGEKLAFDGLLLFQSIVMEKEKQKQAKPLQKLRAADSFTAQASALDNKTIEHVSCVVKLSGQYCLSRSRLDIVTANAKRSPTPIQTMRHGGAPRWVWCVLFIDSFVYFDGDIATAVEMWVCFGCVFLNRIHAPQPRVEPGSHRAHHPLGAF